eukprot:338953-Pleurochrysis_carterae.AAC.4
METAQKDQGECSERYWRVLRKVMERAWRGRECMEVGSWREISEAVGRRTFDTVRAKRENRKKSQHEILIHASV